MNQGKNTQTLAQVEPKPTQPRPIVKGSRVSVPVFGLATVQRKFTRKDGTPCVELVFADGWSGSAPVAEVSQVEG